MLQAPYDMSEGIGSINSPAEKGLIVLVSVFYVYNHRNAKEKVCFLD
jgi:hypothetical protein